MTKETSTIDSSPVTLPAGSYDYETLAAGLDKAAAVQDDEKRAAALRKAVLDADDNDTASADPRSVPGYVFVNRKHEELGIVENIQVPVPDDGKAQKKLIKEVEANGGAAGDVTLPDPAPEAGLSTEAGAPSAAEITVANEGTKSKGE